MFCLELKTPRWQYGGRRSRWEICFSAIVRQLSSKTCATGKRTTKLTVYANVLLHIGIRNRSPYVSETKVLRYFSETNFTKSDMRVIMKSINIGRSTAHMRTRWSTRSCKADEEKVSDRRTWCFGTQLMPVLRPHETAPNTCNLWQRQSASAVFGTVSVSVTEETRIASDLNRRASNVLKCVYVWIGFLSVYESWVPYGFRQKKKEPK